MTGPRAYVDHAATTPLRPEALEAMLPFLTQDFANPSGAHAESRIARVALDDARDQIGALLGVGPGEVVLTSGGTEADDLAIQGGWDAVSAHGEPKGRHAAPNGGLGAPNGAPGATPVVVCAAMEHHAVLEACRALAQRTGAVLRCVPSDAEGIVDLDALAEACDGDVRVVSVMTPAWYCSSMPPTSSEGPRAWAPLCFAAAPRCALGSAAAARSGDAEAAPPTWPERWGWQLRCLPPCPSVRQQSPG